ncbi:NAD(P)-dependent alcohol dehydrogenase [Haliea sp. AH-315-K21]|uniref:NAD(P)-dependent alcohol dehydrogenase n=1 Tax=SAR86 cluster bacterium TaxID=2030880 RepID=A0A2A5CBK0_9GAMM|nr:NAD(P)-dependent alcohol dehydrogenase [Haliea sp. AH-315-K21]PCJ41229.1 MAG: NAD(P)-dependent alcohol dehydrogenase [SAR86 cluster bacterium]
MKAIRIKQPAGLDNLQYVDIDDASAPGAGEMLVKIHASSLNFHDYAVVTGRTNPADGRIPMSDGAGVVEAVGEGVTAFKVGDHVVSCFFPDWQDGPATIGDFLRTPGDGIDGYAREWVTKPTSWFTHAPEGYSHVEAATLTTAGLTAWRALVVNGGLKAGDTVLVLGTGGVSIFALQIAQSMGARVFATSSSDAKIERLKTLGAEQTVNYRSHENWGENVLEWTEGRGVDHIIEVGGPATLPQSITACRIGGHISLIGVLTGIQGDIPTANFMRKQQRMEGLIVGSRRHQQEMITAINATGLKPIIDREFALSELADAFRHEESGKHFGKIGVII